MSGFLNEEDPLYEGILDEFTGSGAVPNLGAVRPITMHHYVHPEEEPDADDEDDLNERLLRRIPKSSSGGQASGVRKFTRGSSNLGVGASPSALADPSLGMRRVPKAAGPSVKAPKGKTVGGTGRGGPAYIQREGTLFVAYHIVKGKKMHLGTSKDSDSLLQTLRKMHKSVTLVGEADESGDTVLELVHKRGQFVVIYPDGREVPFRKHRDAVEHGQGAARSMHFDFLDNSRRRLSRGPASESADEDVLTESYEEGVLALFEDDECLTTEEIAEALDLETLQVTKLMAGLVGNGQLAFSRDQGYSVRETTRSGSVGGFSHEPLGKNDADRFSKGDAGGRGPVSRKPLKDHPRNKGRTGGIRDDGAHIGGPKSKWANESFQDGQRVVTPVVLDSGRRTTMEGKIGKHKRSPFKKKIWPGAREESYLVHLDNGQRMYIPGSKLKAVREDTQIAEDLEDGVDGAVVVLELHEDFPDEGVDVCEAAALLALEAANNEGETHYVLFDEADHTCLTVPAAGLNAAGPTVSVVYEAAPIDEADSREQAAFKALFKKELGDRDLESMSADDKKKLFKRVKAKWAPHAANTPEQDEDVDEGDSPAVAKAKQRRAEMLRRAKAGQFKGERTIRKMGPGDIVAYIGRQAIAAAMNLRQLEGLIKNGAGMDPKSFRHIGVFESEEDVDEAFNAADKRVIDAFLDQRPAEGRRLSTDGKSLDLQGMGGRGAAVWSNGKIYFEDLGSRGAQEVERAVRRAAPRNMIGEFEDDDADAVSLDEETFKQARENILGGLDSNPEWTVARTDSGGRPLKVPHATRGRDLRLWFKGQSVHFSQGLPPWKVNQAHSLISDYRGWDARRLLQAVDRWIDENDDADEAVADKRTPPGFVKGKPKDSHYICENCKFYDDDQDGKECVLFSFPVGEHDYCESIVLTDDAGERVPDADEKARLKELGEDELDERRTRASAHHQKVRRILQHQKKLAPDVFTGLGVGEMSAKIKGMSAPDIKTAVRDMVKAGELAQVGGRFVLKDDAATVAARRSDKKATRDHKRKRGRQFQAALRKRYGEDEEPEGDDTDAASLDEVGATGRPQKALLAWLAKNPGLHELSDISPSLPHTIGFRQIQSAASGLGKKGLIFYDGVSRVRYTGNQNEAETDTVEFNEAEMPSFVLAAKGAGLENDFADIEFDPATSVFTATLPESVATRVRELMTV